MLAAVRQPGQSRRFTSKPPAREIWDDTDGRVDFLISGVGTGGTITGVSEYIKPKKPSFKAVAVEPADSAVLSGGPPGPHKIQGLGGGFIPSILRRDYIDEVITVTNDESIDMARRMPLEEGLLVGISSGAAQCATLPISSRKDVITRHKTTRTRADSFVG
jgi:cysteine synthase A